MNNLVQKDKISCQNVLFEQSKKLQDAKLETSSFEVELNIIEKNLKLLQVYSDNTNCASLTKFSYQRQTTTGFMIGDGIVFVVGLISLAGGIFVVNNTQDTSPLYVAVSSLGLGVLLKIGTFVYYNKQNNFIKKFDIKRQLKNEVKIISLYKTIENLLEILSRRNKNKLKVRVTKYNEVYPRSLLGIQHKLTNRVSSEEEIEDSDDEGMGVSKISITTSMTKSYKPLNSLSFDLSTIKEKSNIKE